MNPLDNFTRVVVPEEFIPAMEWFDKPAPAAPAVCTALAHIFHPHAEQCECKRALLRGE
jgi:hypothetical protein